MAAVVAVGGAVVALWPAAFAVADTLSGLWIGVVLPVSIGVAILRHRLFDIDLIARRALAYAVLWLAITVVYAAIAAAFGLAAGSQLPVAAAILATIVTTIAFDPARRTLERAADRLVYRDRQHRRQRLAEFGDQLASAPPHPAGPSAGPCWSPGAPAHWARSSPGTSPFTVPAGSC